MENNTDVPAWAAENRNGELEWWEPMRLCGAPTFEWVNARNLNDGVEKIKSGCPAVR